MHRGSESDLALDEVVEVDLTDDIVASEAGVELMSKSGNENEPGGRQEVVDICILPKGKECEKFLNDTCADQSLTPWRMLADKGTKGFSWKGGRLIRKVTDNLCQNNEVLCVPDNFISRLLKIAHEQGGI